MQRAENFMSKLRQRENWLHREQRGLWITLPILFVSCVLKNNTPSHSMKSHSKCLKGPNFELKYEHINYVFPQQVCKPMKSPVGEYKYFLGQHLGKKVKCYKINPLVHVT